LLFKKPDGQNASVITENENPATVTETPVVLPTYTSTLVATPVPPSPTALVLAPSATVPTPVEATATPVMLSPVPVQIAVPTTVAETLPVVYELRLVRNREDSLFIINQTTDHSLLLAPLQVGERRGAIQGSEWGLAVLDAGACVTVWKDGGNPRPPDVTCTVVGERITRRGAERFWKDRYNVYYDGNLVGECSSDDCIVHITGG
jgi:hypothetical protein